MLVSKFKELCNKAIAQYNKYMTDAERVYDGATESEQTEMRAYITTLTHPADKE